MIDKILLTTSAIDCVSMHNYWLSKQHWKIPEPQRARSRSARYCCWMQQHTCFQWKHDNNVECPTICLAPCRCLTSRMASLWWWASVNHREKEKQYKSIVVHDESELSDVHLLVVDATDTSIVDQWDMLRIHIGTEIGHQLYLIESEFTAYLWNLIE